MRSDFSTRIRAAMLGIAIAIAIAAGASQHASAQGLPQLENGFENTFSEEGAPADPEPPGPTARTGIQFEGGTAYGGWQNGRIKDGGGTVVAGSSNETAGAPGTVKRPSFTPKAQNGTEISSQTIQLESVQMGRPLVLRTVSFPLGSEIPRPDRTPSGAPLDPNVFAEAEFYLKEPDNAATGRFYWSPHAEKVFATEPGVITINWEERISGTIFSQNYTISGAPAKPPRRLFWTERAFSGPLVQVPEQRVKGVNVIHNNAFPERVAAEPATGPGNPPALGELVSFDYDQDNPYDPTEPGIRLPPEVRTLWYDDLDKSIHAYNIEGRVFVELLGDLREPERIHREHLGFELVDVIQEIRATELRVSIGERVLPVAEAELTPEDEALEPEIIAGMGLDADPYLHEHLSLGGTKRNLYAIKETTPLRLFDLNDDGMINELDEQQSNEVLIYWKETGAMQLLWPHSYVGYIFKWPEEYLSAAATENDLRGFYSLYARPEDSADWSATGVQLNSTDNPVLVYQDDPTRQHAQITPQNVFYTVPITVDDRLATRSLIRYTNGESIWFERVYSRTNSDFDALSRPPIMAEVGARILPETASEVDTAATEKGTLLIDFGSVTYTGTSSPAHADGWLSAAATNWNIVGSAGSSPAVLFADGSPAASVSVDVGTLPGGAGPVNWAGVPTSAGDDAADDDTGVLEEELMSYYLRGTIPDGVAARIGGLPEGRYWVYFPRINSGAVAIGVDDDDDTSVDFDRRLVDPGFSLCEFGPFGNETWVNGSNYALATVEITPTTDQIVIVSDLRLRGLVVVPDTRLLTSLPDAAAGAANGLVGHIRQERGTAFNPVAYVDPFAEGFDAAARGAIIPVNAIPGNDRLEVWWYERSSPPAGTPFSQTLWPAHAQHYQLVWPDTPPAEEIVLAANAGSGALGIAAAGTIYRQPDPNLPGHNPNEEHALMLAGTAWALRDDLNTATTSRPYVLVDYTAADGRPAMVARRVLRENGTHTFSYAAPVGTILQAPAPLPFIPLPIDASGAVANREVTGAPTDEPTNFAGNSAGFQHYNSFTFNDRKGATWLYRGPHATGVNVGTVSDATKNLTMHYYYKVQEGFDFGTLAAPPVGTIIPYLSDPSDLSDLLEGTINSIESVTPGDVNFIPVWPDDAPVLNIAETLGLPKDGLPAVRGQTSAQLLYEQSIAADMAVKTKSATLFDPTRAKSYAMTQTALGAMHSSVVTSDYLGKTYFPNLPPHLSQRLFYDPNIGTLGSLVFIGEFVDAPLGDDCFLLNVLSPQDEADAKALAGGNLDWDAAIDGLSTTLEEFAETAPGSGVFQVTDSSPVGENQLAEINDDDIAVDSYALSAVGGGTGFVVMITGDGEAFTPPGEPVSVHVLKVAAPLHDGELKIVASSNPLDEKLTLRHSSDFAGDPTDYEFEWTTAAPVGGAPPAATPGTGPWQPVATDAPQHTIAGASILTLSDNYFSMHYRAKAGTAAAFATGGNASTPGVWSAWTQPQLAEGWIKRVLAGLNPFEQRVTDLFNNSVNTDVSLLTQAGTRWEGNISLNLENIDDFGFIEIYETVLNRGKDLSIGGSPPINYAPANDALLLAAGYLSDLYMLLGNEAFADAANPTIAFDTAGGDFGEFNTALFAFKGQLASVLEEELALLRGRDDNSQPAIDTAPVYNRLVWNFTRGINSGEAIYSLNYNIQDNNTDGAADAADAAVQYPQGHGDAYGHYLTALKVYYNLLADGDFSWEPRSEAVTVLGQAVTIDYQDERKFAAAAAAHARASSQTLDLTYRKEFTSDENAGWSHLEDDTVSRAWGTDEWACRAGQGALFHWVTANSILPEEDTDPSHEGIEIVDRTTVPELDELAAQAETIQRTLDNADARLNPLGLAKGAIPFDISPSEIDAGKTHYEQIFDRAVGSLKNAVFAFDNAKRSTEFLRGQENGIAEQRAAIDAQEQAFENSLVEIYGTPYPDDIGPGKTYVQGYAGPDLLHFGYVETPELFFDPSTESQHLDLPLDPSFEGENPDILATGGTVSYRFTARGELVKPVEWTGTRTHPGAVQTAVSNLFSARLRLRQALDSYGEVTDDMGEMLALYQNRVTSRDMRLAIEDDFEDEINAIEAAVDSTIVVAEQIAATIEAAINASEAVSEALPTSIGFSNDATSPARGAIKAAGAVSATASAVQQVIELTRVLGLQEEAATLEDILEERTEEIAWDLENRQLIDSLRAALDEFRDRRIVVDMALRDLDQAQRDLQTMKSRGLAIQRERETFRKRAAAIVQGYRTRDLAFRVFRDEALEKYKTLFDLAARYSFLAARAYDYETGLLDQGGSSAAAEFFDSIVQSRALGVVDADGNPQFTASTTGDPGLAGVLAQMQGDWSVAETRLGFNNPDLYRTTFSLRQEKFRITPRAAGDSDWADQLASFTKPDVLADPDVRRYCMQVATEDGLPVPGIVIPFQTTIARGFNFFGKPILGGDHLFSNSSFATKIRNSGIAFDGYIGMDDPTSIAGPVGGAGGESPDDPDLGFLEPNRLAATPFVYLIPAGVDSMRSPPLGDTSKVRSWSVDDQAIPLPFNIGNTDFSTNSGFISSDSLSEDPFAIRKHQSFRAVPSGTVFASSPAFTNSRLIGRSVWNSQWKLVILGDTLHNNPDVGLEIFRATVTDIELFFETYSYSGN